jgi:hypothetical protein
MAHSDQPRPPIRLELPPVLRHPVVRVELITIARFPGRAWRGPRSRLQATKLSTSAEIPPGSTGSLTRVSSRWFPARGIVALREAHRRLVEAKHDKGGFRVQALGLIHQAMVQVREGIRFANTRSINSGSLIGFVACSCVPQERCLLARIRWVAGTGSRLGRVLAQRVRESTTEAHWSL